MSSAQDVFPVASSARKSLRLILFPFLGAERKKARKTECQYLSQGHAVHEISPFPWKAAATATWAAPRLYSRILGSDSCYGSESEESGSDKCTHTLSSGFVNVYGKGSEERSVDVCQNTASEPRTTKTSVCPQIA